MVLATTYTILPRNQQNLCWVYRWWRGSEGLIKCEQMHNATSCLGWKRSVFSLSVFWSIHSFHFFFILFILPARRLIEYCICLSWQRQIKTKKYSNAELAKNIFLSPIIYFCLGWILLKFQSMENLNFFKKFYSKKHCGSLFTLWYRNKDYENRQPIN